MQKSENCLNHYSQLDQQSILGEERNTVPISPGNISRRLMFHWRMLRSAMNRKWKKLN